MKNKFLKLLLLILALAMVFTFVSCGEDDGDGTNDVYRVKTQSLLSFRMKIFNRWGQEIVSGDHTTLATEHENDHTYYVCWDGTYRGSYVEDGVYFILVEAEGSDGIKYVRRGDINILTKSRKEAKQ